MPTESLIVFSHLRWDFVFQRPQHLMTRFAKHRRVFYVEEPIYDAAVAGYRLHARGGSVTVVVPHLPPGLGEARNVQLQRELVDCLIAEQELSDLTLWYYTPMAMPFTRHLSARAVVYDCMDELSLFLGAPKQLLECERELFQSADLVFTGGRSLFEAKRGLHPNVHLFPSSVDVEHFGAARRLFTQPEGQASIPRPRFGFFGVIDERMDLQLLQEVAHARPDWQLVLLGPVVKIDPARLPRAPNLHYPGARSYAELPAWIAGWDVALLPFALNDSTRFISPTKTPEYLAAGKPVVSAPIRDVVAEYGDRELVYIADGSAQFVAAMQDALRLAHAPGDWLQRVDACLRANSWDKTWSRMERLLGRVEDRFENVQRRVS